MQHTLKKGDTGISLEGVLLNTNEITGEMEPYSIPGGSTVRVLMTAQGDSTLKVNALSTPDADQTANPGKWSYAWQNADVDTAGIFDIELLLTLPNAKKIRFPRSHGETYGTVEILEAKS